LLLSQAEALAFGAAGHEAVCEIAYRELTAHAKSRVDALIAQETDTRIQSFRDSCGWPDFPGAQQSVRRPEHYINVPRYWGSIFYRRCHQVPTCLFTAIDADVDILENQFSSDQERLTALKFLGHWIGDIHQPLHVSYEDDRGGNDVLVTGVAGCSNGGETKLHAVWDTCIPNDIMQELGASGVAPNDDDREAFGMLLWSSITPQQRAAWKATLSPLDWANESLAIARHPAVGYCILSGTVCHYSQGSDEYEPNLHDEDEGKRVLNAPASYEDDFGPAVTERMQRAGVRLGAILNQILGN
jgi:hypothetical protein